MDDTPCMLLVNYTDSPLADSFTLEGFKRIFKTGPLEALKAFVPRKDAAERMRKAGSNDFGTIYC